MHQPLIIYYLYSYLFFIKHFSIPYEILSNYYKKPFCIPDTVYIFLQTNHIFSL